MKKIVFSGFLLLALVLAFGQSSHMVLAVGPTAIGVNPIQIADDIVKTAVNETVTTVVTDALSLRSDMRVLGGERTISAGSVVEQNIIVMGGELEVEHDAAVYGDITVYGGEANFDRMTEIYGDVRVYGGDLSIDGTVYGDVITLGGETELRSSAVVEGDVKTVGGKVNRSRSAVIKGDIMHAPIGGVTIDLDRHEVIEHGRSGFWPLSIGARMYQILFGSFISFVFYLIIAMLGALLLMKIGPKHVSGAESFLVKAPWMTFLIGVAIAVLIVPLVVILLSVTILLIPLALLLVLGLIIAMFYGFVILGSLIGKELKRRIGLDWDPVRLTVLGTALLVISFQVINMLPSWIDWIPEFIAVSLGVGAVSQYLYDQVISKGKANSAILSASRPGPVTIPSEGTLDQPESFKAASSGAAEPGAPASGDQTKNDGEGAGSEGNPG